MPGWTIGTAAAGVALLLVNSAFTMLKEDPAFWRDAGGYPAGLREAVLAGYYPLLGLNIVLCGVLSGLVVYEHRARRCGCSWWTLAAGVLMWTLLCLNIGLLTANNVENLMDGKALHYHPGGIEG